MGALSGSVTASLYFVDGELPKDFRDRYLEALSRRKFTDIEPSSDAEESLGWVTVQDPFDTEFNLNKVLWGDYLMATLRHDSIKIPPAVFKLYFRKELALWLEKTGREKATKHDEEEVKDLLTKKLRKQVLPNIKTYDVVWNIQRNLVWLFTTNKRVNEIFQEYFHDAFELPLIPKNPYSLIERLGNEDLLGRAVEVEPANLAVPNT